MGKKDKIGIESELPTPVFKQRLESARNYFMSPKMKLSR